MESQDSVEQCQECGQFGTHSLKCSHQRIDAMPKLSDIESETPQDTAPKTSGSVATGILLILSSFPMFLVAGGDPGNPHLFTRVFFMALMCLGIFTFSSYHPGLIITVVLLTFSYMLLQIDNGNRLWKCYGLPVFEIVESILLAGAIITACITERS